MWSQMGVSKNSGNTPKMDGENNGNPYFSNGINGMILGVEKATI